MADSAAAPKAAPAAAAAPVALFKRRGAKGKANIRKRPATPPPADSDDDSDFSSSEDESGARIKRRKKNSSGPVAASSRNHAGSTDKDAAIARQTIFEADRNLKLDSSNDATKMVDWFDQEKEGELSTKSLLGRTRARHSQPEEPGRGEAPPALDGTYKGMANRATYIQKNPNAPNRTVGPIKAPTNIRTITIVDMAPDVCKDYKQTGFCGFGDNCKFLHAREDYQHGWQLDKEWENVTKGKKVIGGTVVASADRRNKTEDDEKEAQDEEEAAMLENIPFVCIICKGPYKSPVVTRCGHYFCESCALKRYRKDPGCAACGAGTNGVFNAAKKLQKLLDRKRERAASARQEAVEAGEEVSEEEGGGEGEWERRDE
ncbi:hypothetical protein B0T22DRAFT_418279 [Podospora appendiculata]|uniref:Pre-mRNA-splicing factor CWC24 n=1 Tax=Podospora appendiculata TaxID=314037 RepID=A0AAE0XLD1_9PEZI|nr:hypothetical protein B0T22DRAFT_418279 [Podospora appendiculata]